MEVKLKELNMIMEGTDALYHEAARRLGLSDAQMFILYILFERGEGYAQKDFCSLTGIGKTTINTAVKNMEKDGYLILKAINGRSTGVYLTDKGRELMNNTVARLIEIENQIFDSWTEEERQLIIKLNRDFMNKLDFLVKKL